MARGQGHKRKCSRKKNLHKNFLGDLQKNKNFRQSSEKYVFQKIFQALRELLTTQKKCCPRAEDRAIFEASRPRTSKCVFEDVLEAKDVFENYTFG